MPRKSKSTDSSKRKGSLARRIGALRRERDQLEEEVIQLRAAASIWEEVCRQTAGNSGRGEKSV